MKTFFEDRSGRITKGSSNRLIIILTTTVILGAWIYCTIKQIPMIDVPASVAAILASVFGLSGYNKKIEAKKEVEIEK